MSIESDADATCRDRKRADAMFLVVIIAGLITGGVYGLNEDTAIIPSQAALAVYAVCGLAALIAFTLGARPYWRAIGETARRNHLDAWFWGGSLGFTLMGAAIAIVALGNAPVSLPIAHLAPAQLLGIGAGALAAATLGGYALHWIILTLLRRPS